VALATLTFPLRTVRWQLILRDIGGKRFPLLPLWHATAIGFMANNLLPVRAGEFARAYAAQQQLPVRFSTALASVGVERVLDGLLLVGLMMLAIASPAFPRHAQIGMTSVSPSRPRARCCCRVSSGSGSRSRPPPGSSASSKRPRASRSPSTASMRLER